MGGLEAGIGYGTKLRKSFQSGQALIYIWACQGKIRNVTVFRTREQIPLFFILFFLNMCVDFMVVG